MCLYLSPGRLTKEDIESMVQEADQYRAEDEAQKENVTAKNSLESLAFNMKSTVDDKKLTEKISPEDVFFVVSNGFTLMHFLPW